MGRKTDEQAFRELLVTFGLMLLSLAVVIGAIFWSVPAHGAVRAKVMERLQRSFVHVAASHGDQIGVGSGSVVEVDQAGSLVLTCAHVVTEDGKPSEHIFVAFEVGDGRLDGAEAKIEKLDVAHDLALLRVEATTGEPLPVAATAPPRWARLFVMGAPFNGPATGGEAMLASRSTTFNAHGPAAWHFVGLVSPGSSGGPVVNERGELVCVAQAMRAGTAIYGICVPLDQVIDFLASYQLGRRVL
jgi:S1-C subfamily serine protease